VKLAAYTTKNKTKKQHNMCWTPRKQTQITSMT